MKNIVFVFLAMIPFVLPLSTSLAEELPPVEKKEIVQILANFKILAEVGFPESKVHVRVIEAMDHGECAGGPATCPKSTIYIATSEYGEYPEQKVFQSEKLHGWEFVDWVSFPESEGPDDYIVFNMKAKRPAEDIKNKWWNECVFEVKVNYHQAQIIQK